MGKFAETKSIGDMVRRVHYHDVRSADNVAAVSDCVAKNSELFILRQFGPFLWLPLDHFA